MSSASTVRDSGRDRGPSAGLRTRARHAEHTGVVLNSTERIASRQRSRSGAGIIMGWPHWDWSTVVRNRERNPGAAPDCLSIAAGH